MDSGRLDVGQLPGPKEGERKAMSREPDEPQPNSVLFIGDIHGCLEPLERLLRAAQYNPDHHRLIPVGDLTNRGPDNLGVLLLLFRLGAEPILGNHEVKLLEWSDGDRDPSWIFRQSLGKDFLHSARQDQWLDWIKSWPYWRGGEEWLTVHAGLHPQLPVKETPPKYLANVRLCTPDGQFPKNWYAGNPNYPDGFQPWHSYYKGKRRVLYGHWARQGLHRTSNTLALDSGCVYGRPLTGWWYPEDRLVQVSGSKEPVSF